MIDKPAKIFSRGLTTIRSNPQLVYTIFLLIAIPVAFLFIADNFLSISQSSQETIEKGRIGLFQDTFVSLAAERITDYAFLKQKISDIKKQNNAITDLKVLSYQNGDIKVLTSLNESEEGLVDSANESFYRAAGLDLQHSFIFEVYVGNERQWKAIRAITNGNNEVVGFLLTNISMSEIDRVLKNNINNAYLISIVVLLLIFLLLVRHARIIDYTVLYAKLREVDQMKDDFISMAAHELRTPLAIIRGYIDDIKQKGQVKEEGKDALLLVGQSADNLTLLINDILDVSRLEQGRMNFFFVDIDLAEFLPVVLSTFQKVAETKGLILKQELSSDHSIISVDADRLKQILVNIIGNAIKYTNVGEVRVKLSSDSKKSIIRVSDTGMGISAEDQKHLFEKFFRVKGSETASISGTGLGLWITRQIVEAMHGTIAVESIKSKGTDFVLIFPKKVN